MILLISQTLLTNKALSDMHATATVLVCFRFLSRSADQHSCNASGLQVHTHLPWWLAAKLLALAARLVHRSVLTHVTASRGVRGATHASRCDDAAQSPSQWSPWQMWQTFAAVNGMVGMSFSKKSSGNRF